ncbi:MULTISPECIES: hypothetical protein [Pseudomonas]|uniref:hypothetical protein n=1 Tax=Pseudomonas TaxID=286 RepID=UPI00099CF9DC|nr:MULTISPECIES: hypothetical protein [Pseudomonas]MCK3838825.1 hypothetical protein [Pseudomonas sp. NCIMB 10586]OPB05663.1 hypothetical protein BFW89_10150 [Pseudomonas synxantha]VCU67908.1 Pseudomonas_9032-product Hypothetical new protein [Pseudomonas synxantha]
MFSLLMQPFKQYEPVRNTAVGLADSSEVRLDLVGQLNIVGNSLDSLCRVGVDLSLGEETMSLRPSVGPLKKSKLKVVRYVFDTWDFEEGDAGSLSDVYGLGCMNSERCKGALALQVKGEFARLELHLEIFK